MIKNSLSNEAPKALLLKDSYTLDAFALPAPLPSSSPSTPTFNESGDNNWGGMDIDEQLSDSWWERVKYYAQLAIERVENGVDAVKELLSTLTSDERWGVILEFEKVEPQKFGQMIADVHDWVQWMG
ncbi:hypothetical protein [uncultured Nostoc sp.]|uniref:hypothetical protein n=1 Tax=uncultured Nostoc sp. TaxID=340711 RepID=UPI0035CAB1EE